MGISGLLSQLSHSSTRTSLAKLAADHYALHSRPLRLAIDISIWLFQIQSGKGGSNPALRTFYYRLLRLITLSIHPLFVFDGPNKPLFKRNKKVGGPGVRVATVPEFLAKQLLKHFGFPIHIAPGEAEAECALLQREGLVDAVMSEDVDTLMFGSGMTLRNWTSEGSTKSPTHIDVYRCDETKAKTGLDGEGMVLVALMSGGDYLPEGIPGCGIKCACDAARAGFGAELIEFTGRNKHDKPALRAALGEWKERLQHEIRTNASKFFSRKNTTLAIPPDFPNLEVLRNYTHPCISSPSKLQKLRESLRWDQPIDYPSLREFTAEAFDWRCKGGAKKFVRNLAPAMLVRELRLRSGGSGGSGADVDEQEKRERELVHAIHGKRNHYTVDGELEYRISFTPLNLVPIDLDAEEDDDEYLAGGGGGGADSDAESEIIPPSTQQQVPGDDESEVPTSPSKKRTTKPYDPSVPEKQWLLRTFLRVGCPLLVEDYEAASKDPREFLKVRQKARAAAAKVLAGGNIHAPSKPKKGQGKGKQKDMPENALMVYGKVSKAGASSQQQQQRKEAEDEELDAVVGAFKMPSTQIPRALMPQKRQQRVPPAMSATQQQRIEVLDLATSVPTPLSIDPARPFAAFTQPRASESQRTPNRASKKRPSPDLSSPATSQKTILSFYSPSPRKAAVRQENFVNLISSPSTSTPTPKASPREPVERSLTPTPPNTRFNFIRSSPDLNQGEISPGKLPDTVTKRRRKGPLKRWQTAPASAGREVEDDGEVSLPTPTSREATPLGEWWGQAGVVGTIDLVTSSPGEGLISPSRFVVGRRKTVDADANPVEAVTFMPRDDNASVPLLSSPPPSPRTAPLFVIGDIRTASWLMDTYATTCNPPTDMDELPPPSSLPTPPAERSDDDVSAINLPKPNIKTSKSKQRQAPSAPSCRRSPKLSVSQPLRRSPRQQVVKKRIQLRESMEGWWKEVEPEAIDMSGDGSGWKKSGGRAEIRGWRKSGVEVLDLTGV